MMFGLHTGSILHTNLATDLRVAGEAGYDAVELTIPKLVRYLDAGYRPEDLLPAVGSLRVAMIDSFLHIERQDVESRRELRQQCERLCAVAEILGCSRLQVVPLNALQGVAWREMREGVARSLQELAGIAAPHGVSLVMEPVSFTPLRTLAQALEVLEAADRANITLCIDTFHLWTGGTPWEEVTALDPGLIGAVHISDVSPRRGNEWSDDDRDVLPGDGILPLREGIAAIQATGYDGLWSVEMLGAYHWEWDPVLLAQELKRRLESLVA
jgi:sugar phosphate isomerase/epimerase